MWNPHSPKLMRPVLAHLREKKKKEKTKERKKQSNKKKTFYFIFVSLFLLREEFSHWLFQRALDFGSSSKVGSYGVTFVLSLFFS